MHVLDHVVRHPAHESDTDVSVSICRLGAISSDLWYVCTGLGGGIQTCVNFLCFHSVRRQVSGDINGTGQASAIIKDSMIGLGD